MLTSCLMTKFTDWLESELKSKNMSPADLARATRKDQSIVSRILRGEREPRPQTLNAIAHALKISPEEIYRAAGLLPPKPDAEELIEQAEHIINNYKYPETKRRALAYLEFLREEEEKAEYRAKPARRPTVSEPG